MEIVRLDLSAIDIAEQVWSLQHLAYRLEAALIGVRDLPPLHDTIRSLQSCDEIFIGYRGGEAEGEDEAELIGAISYLMEQEGCYTLCRLMVHPNYIRQGIGRLLVSSFLSQLPSNSYTSVTAEIRNIPAIALYTQLGFIASTTHQPAPGISMLRLERPVNMKENDPKT